MVPYHLPEELRAETVYVCEGEKDCNSLEALQLAATCNPMGAGKWRDEYLEHLRGKHGIILPDADPLGYGHAMRVAQSLMGVAASVGLVELPGAKDASDWIEQGGTKEALLGLAEAAAPLTPEVLAAFAPKHGLSPDGRQPGGAKSKPKAPSVGLVSRYRFNPGAELPPERIYYQGLLVEGDLVTWVGHEKSRKSTLVLQLAVCAALGRDFLKFPFVFPRPLKVTMIDYESKVGSLKRRYDAMCLEMDLGEAELRRLRRNLRIIQVREIHRAGLSFPRFPFRRGDTQAGQFWKDLIAANPADIFVVDPMRSLHARDENDSLVEELLSDIRQYFRSTVIVVHHMRKQSADKAVAQADTMRLWSDGAPGSGAIKAHSDVVVCQERVELKGDDEVVWWGVFLKDGADIQPMPLRESDAETFFWELSAECPGYLQTSFEALMPIDENLSEDMSITALAAYGKWMLHVMRPQGDLLAGCIPNLEHRIMQSPTERLPPA